MPGFEWVGEEERAQVLEVLDQGFSFRYNFDAQRQGIFKARELELEICAKTGSAHAHLVSSGTTALITAMAAAGVGFGDEVLLPPFTFVASMEAILAVGAVPVFVDIDETLGLSAAAVEAAITPRTKAVNAVHMCGVLCDMDGLRAVCEKHGLVLLEDASQALGASLRGQMAGTLGDIGGISFDSVKTVSCGEGGVVLTDNSDWHALAHQYSDHGHDHIGMDRGAEKHPILGTNFRISELNAAMGLAQWRKLDAIVETQRHHCNALADAVGSAAGVTRRQTFAPDADSGAFLTILLDSEADANAALAQLKAVNFPGFVSWYHNRWHYFKHWQHLHQLASPHRLALSASDHPDYASQQLPVSDALMARAISFPIALNWDEAALAQRVDLLQQVFA